MSAEDLVALIQGLLPSLPCQKMDISPDNSCCFCLTLRSGSILIGAGNCLLYLILFSWYLLSHGSLDASGLEESFGVTSLDISIFSIFCVQNLVNISLVVGAVKRNHSHTFPWLCANVVSIMIFMFCIGVTILFGTTKLSLNYSEYVTSLAIMGLITGINLFCWIVVFTFRKNLMMEAQSIHLPSVVAIQCPGISNPSPPSYYEIEGYQDCKPPPCPEEAPPEYEAAVAMLAQEDCDEAVKGPVKRKKSLTNYEV